MTKIIDQGGNELVWTAVYWRHYVQHREECGSLEDAVRFLREGEYHGTLSMDSIICPDGKAIKHDRKYADGTDQLFNMVYEWGPYEKGMPLHIPS
jgi:hypothetical protein